MITVITPATSTRLTTIERARALLGFAGSDDVMVGTLIDQASRVIVDYCRRPFGLETIRESFDGPARSGGVLLGRSAVTAIIEVKEGSDVVPLANVRHDPDSGMLFHVGDDGWRLCWQLGVLVTYSAGYVLPLDANGSPASTLPPSIERAAIRLVGAYLSLGSRDALIKSETTEGVGATSYWVPAGSARLADPEAEGLLTDYRRLF